MCSRFTAFCAVLLALFVLVPARADAQWPTIPSHVDARSAIALCYGMGATTPRAMQQCSGRQVSPGEFVQCMQGGACFGAPATVAIAPPQPVPPAPQDLSCGTAGRYPCPAAMPCGYSNTIQCPTYAATYQGGMYQGMMQVAGAAYCGAVGYPPCAQPQPCGLVGTLACTPPQPLYVPPPGQGVAIPPDMRQATMLPFEPDVQVVLPSVPDHTPGTFGAPEIPPGFGFNFGGDNRPPNEIPAAPTTNIEFVPTSHPDLDRLQTCRASAATERAFGECVAERAMPRDYRILKSCAAGYKEVVKAWLCSSDDARLLPEYERIEATIACTRGVSAGSPQARSCLARSWMGQDEQRITACFGAGATQASVRGCLAQTSLASRFGPYTPCALRGGSADVVAACLGQAAVAERYADFASCAQQQGNPVTVARCFAAPFAGSQERAMLTCVEGAPPTPQAIAGCISAQTMGQKEVEYLRCATSSNGNKTEWARCFGNQALGRGERVYLECALAGGAPATVAACAGRTFLGAQTQGTMLGCAVTANGSMDRLATCLGPLALGERENAILNCATSTNVGACIASQYMGAEEQRITSCAVENNFDAGTTAVCAMGPKLGINPEMQIALTCAATSGGEPMTFAGCAGGQLGERELSRCWTQGVATAKGCYGPNNSIRQLFDGVDATLRSALGKDNDIYKAYDLYHKNFLSPGKNQEFVKLVNAGINDLRNGPGKNNDIRKAATAVEKGFHKVQRATRIKITL